MAPRAGSTRQDRHKLLLASVAEASGVDSEAYRAAEKAGVARYSTAAKPKTIVSFKGFKPVKKTATLKRRLAAAAAPTPGSRAREATS